MVKQNYYTLMTSLPHLPRFDQAERIPISRERLLNRLKMLDSEDYRLADLAAQFIAWRRQALGKTTKEVLQVYEQLVNQTLNEPLLAEILSFPINQRTLMTALRKKELSGEKPLQGEVWGAGPLVRTIESQWDSPLFNLGYVYPWIVQAQSHLKNRDFLKLEHLLMTQLWFHLDKFQFKNAFGFEAVVAYLLKWDMIDQWLSYKKEVAKSRFNDLVLETIHEYDRALAL